MPDAPAQSVRIRTSSNLLRLIKNQINQPDQTDQIDQPNQKDQIEKIVKSVRAVAQTNRLPFDRLRANGDLLKSCDFSVHAELVEA